MKTKNKIIYIALPSLIVLGGLVYWVVLKSPEVAPPPPTAEPYPAFQTLTPEQQAELFNRMTQPPQPDSSPPTAKDTVRLNEQMTAKSDSSTLSDKEKERLIEQMTAK